MVEYLAAAKAVLGELPKRDTLVFERFFDESGGQQFIIHAPFGARVNRAFGLSLRKKFCRTFNFELQAAATEDAIVLSLGETHSFDLASVARFLNSKTVEDTLIQAMLDSPMFTARWRWNASISLAIRRSSGGKRTPPQIQRMASEDLIAVLFPDQIACAENLSGPREIPDHPLVKQTLQDCLHDAMDIDGLRNLLIGLETGTIKVIAKDLIEPSPLAAEILNARPYAYPRRRASRRAAHARGHAAPLARPGKRGGHRQARSRGHRDGARTGVAGSHERRRAARCHARHGRDHRTGGRERGLDPVPRRAHRRAPRHAPAHARQTSSGSAPNVCRSSRRSIRKAGAIRTSNRPPRRPKRSGSARRRSPISCAAGCRAWGRSPRATWPRRWASSLSEINIALIELESEGFVLRGRFTEEASAPEAVQLGDATLEWCERRLLARIHRYTIKTLRAEIEPVSGADFMRFLLEWQGVTRQPKPEGVESLAAVVSQLEGYEIPAAAWESDVLAARLNEYDPHWLDSLCLSGRALWARLTPTKSVGAAPVRTTPIALVTRKNWSLWHSLAAAPHEEMQLSHGARALFDYFNDARRVVLRRSRERHQSTAFAGGDRAR